jgi:hypothetical protein
MAYDKPKVTIDLEEYNSLLDERNRIVGDEYIMLAKTVIATLINSQFHIPKSSEELKRHGIAFFVSNSFSTNSKVSPENVIIAKIIDNDTTRTVNT